MSSHFTKEKICWPHSLRAVDRPGFGRFQPAGWRFGRGRSCRTQIHQPFQVPTDAFELQFQSVGGASHIPHPPAARAPLPPPKHFFNLTPDGTEQLVDPQRRRTQLLPSAGLAQNPVGHLVAATPFAPRFTPIRFVGHAHLFIAGDDVLKFFAVMHVGRRQGHLPDQRVRFIHPHMRLITVVWLSMLDRVTRVAVAAGLISLRGRAARGLQQRRIHQRADFQNQALGLQLPVDQRQQWFVQAMLTQPLAEAHQSRFIRHGVLQTQPHKAPPAQTVADELLALRVGQTVAVLEQTHLEERQRRTGRTPGGRRIHRLQRFFQRLPIQSPVEPLQKIIRWRGDHQAVQQSHLCVGRRLHIPLTYTHADRSKEFCRDLNKYMQNKTNQIEPTSNRLTAAAEVSPTPSTLESLDALNAHNSELRDRLLREAAEKPVGRFVQFDYFATSDELFWCVRNELRRGGSSEGYVRLQLPLGTPKAAALRALDGFREMVEVDTDILNEDGCEDSFYQWNYDENK